MSIPADSAWQIYCHPATAQTAHGIAKNIAERLREEVTVQTASELAVQQSKFPELLRTPMNMAAGFPGLALLASYLDRCFPGEEWDTVGHIYLQKAVREIQGSFGYSHYSLFGGLSGVTFATWALSQDGKRYQRLLHTLEQHLFSLIHDMAGGVIGNQTHGCIDSVYDVISGIAGVGAYLLCRRAYPPAAEALQLLLADLVYLAELQDGIPHWHTPSHLVPEHFRSLDQGQGYVNLGLAHGIAGPLALMSVARCYEIEVAGLEKAIAETANWLVDHHVIDEWGINWPVLSILGKSSDDAETSRTAWCYGIPGIASSLWLAGKALKRPDYQEVAIAAMQSVYRRPISARRIDSPCFCHGVAGLLQVSLRFAQSTGEPRFFQAVQDLSEQLIELYHPDSILGYQNKEPGGILVDNPWLLEGVASIVLVLLATSTTCEPVWDRLFLLS